MQTALMRSALALLLPLTLLLLSPPTTTGQLSADRPGFGDGTTTVAPGTFQAELGAAAANDDYGPNAELGQFLLRYGVADFFEIRGGVGSLALNAPDTEYTGTNIGGNSASSSLPCRRSAW